MTEEEWLSHGDYPRFLHRLYDCGSERQLRLFACACCRRVWRFMADERSRNAVEVAERFADGKATRTLRKRTEAEARAASSEARDAQDLARLNATFCAWYTVGRGISREAMVSNVAQDTANAACFVVELGEGGKREDEENAQALLAADIMGSPFRSMTFMDFDPAWRSRSVVGLAKEMYETRVFDRMPILADALRDAGCDNADVLEHCRGTLPHVRGCWVVDLVLGKE